MKIKALPRRGTFSLCAISLSDIVLYMTSSILSFARHNPTPTYLFLVFCVVFAQRAVVAHAHVMVPQHCAFFIAGGMRVGGGSRGRMVEEDKEEGRQEGGEEAAARHVSTAKEEGGARGGGYLCCVCCEDVFGEVFE